MSNKHKHDHSHGIDEFLAILKKHDLKVTPTRKIVIEALIEHHGPFSAEDIQKKFIKKKSDLVTVYRTLTSLEEAKILKRCEFGDGIARYELNEPCEEHHHHHLICKECKTVEVIDACEIEDTVTKMATKRGFTQISHILEFFGLCPGCQP